MITLIHVFYLLSLVISTYVIFGMAVVSITDEGRDILAWAPVYFIKACKMTYRRIKEVWKE